MKFITALAVCALIVAAPAFAQAPGTLPSVPGAIPGAGSIPGVGSIPGAGSMPGANSMLSNVMPGGCQKMLNKISPMLSALQGGSTKTAATSEMSQAKSSLSAGNEADCMTHANKLMGLLR